MIDHQFYPTGRLLAERAFNKFKTPIIRLLESSAGRGDLLAPLGFPEDMPAYRAHSHYRKVPLERIDCIEIDLQNQAILRDKGYRVIASDFLEYTGASVYSHVLQNPPFSAGEHHVLHAWNMIYSGEIVAILNAETLRNLNSKKRQMLARLVELHSASEPEYLEEAFLSPDTQRTTSVEIVIIHLERKGSFHDDYLKSLAKDVKAEATQEDFGGESELMLPKNFVQNQVIAFQCAVKALREHALASVKAAYYASQLGRNLTQWHTNGASNPEGEAAKLINEGYASLKECAWTSILRSTDVTSKLSSAAQRRLEASFKSICDLEFTVSNVYGFLTGLLENRLEIMNEMVCDVFDLFSTYHATNTVHYKGWKSNGKHRTFGHSLKSSRIVLPRCRESFSSGLSWDDLQRFRDFDKVFALLDGGKLPENTLSIEKLCNQQFDNLRAGERCSADYFDVRHYPQAGTFHLFPRRKDLIDKLNRIVGRQRQWLPFDESQGSAAFWEQFNEAEKINKLAEQMPNSAMKRINIWRLQHGDDREKEINGELLNNALSVAAERLGIFYDPSLENNNGGEQLLLDVA